MSDMEYPQDLLYTDKHEWLREAGDGVYRVGITAYAQDALGDVVFVTLPAVGDTFSRDDAAGEVESTKSVSDVYSPLTGEITAVNEALDATPEAVNTDPYGEGWMFEIKVTEASEVEELIDAEAYAATLD
ncbi:glycine cleavage system protein GcvH [Kytococcus sedentarius]|uniref:Glycine cleavage system H protein n=1 Tax=Kytococcus sedentarius (strain ATCC 14392 / DSM 20547 / JCM 11482 / CCUG 33030 / NBRC 15357 / NCTC 11040 / CCM 314 / 541) TaxID=478801 RepID=C7NI14_KYTSD|nr:glycine cleavage system protein GcvH [Kytococcus sedentarius]ACV06521.1 glycine cleavage system H protein [Kytococcus sedentarius DSM 20547]QQB64830.1 glycine cleavage system protein GcvH [Kytococcus sedentarius]STX12053.1 Glycine cleavage system H protein [Kytococcus sedentarius]